MGISDYSILAEIDAGTLERKRCLHPLYDRESLIILARHVTLDAGTGCVHTAPGHGREDYEVGLLYDLLPYSPVDENGCFTGEVEFFEGKFVFDANKDISAKLRDRGALIYEEREVEEEEVEEEVKRDEMEIGLEALAKEHGLEKIIDAVARMSEKD